MEQTRIADKKIRYRDLSPGLKTAIVIAYVVGVIELLAFLVGFILGVAGY